MANSDDPSEDPDLQLAIAMSLQQDEDLISEQASAAASNNHTYRPVFNLLALLDPF
jgi:hypothetical protein